METLTLYRISSTVAGTFGVLCRDGLPLCVTCELPWRDNKKSISCIPAGLYPVKRWISPSKGRVFLLHGTEPRDKVLIHIANKPAELEGCIAVGKYFTQFTGVQGVALSRDTMAYLLKTLPDEFNLDIRNSYEH